MNAFDFFIIFINMKKKNTRNYRGVAVAYFKPKWF